MPTLNYGGMERLVVDIVRCVDAERLESHILVLKQLGRFSRELGATIQLHQARPLPRYSMLWPGPLVSQIREIAPDVVHTHSGVWYKATLAARSAGVRRIIHTDHGRQLPDPWVARFVDGLAARRTDVVVAVSEALAGHLKRTVVPRQTRVEVIPNGVDTAAFRPGTDGWGVRSELGIPPQVPIVGSVGRLQRIKGYDVMLQAFARLRQEWTDGEPPVLVIAGDGAERERLERFVADSGLAAGVHLLGWRDDLHDLHAAFTLFTMASRSEGTSVSLLEAMSSGVCPVVTDVGGNRAVLGPLLEHRLVPPDDPAALASAWRRALSNAEARVRDAAAARGRVEAAFSLEAMVRRYEALYAAAPGARRPRSPSPSAAEPG
jgi:glycosyltransferase involved in cell wall biosynthesis